MDNERKNKIEYISQLDSILKASVAFILPYKYCLSVFMGNWLMGNCFPKPLNIFKPVWKKTGNFFWKENKKIWEREI